MVKMSDKPAVISQMPGLFKKLISYVFPLVLEVRKGDVTPVLEVGLVRGKIVLNAGKVNYSFGTLHKVFRKIFKILKPETREPENILLIGLGTGSVVRILREELDISAPITAIEPDTVVIELGGRFFNIGAYKNLTIYNTDGFEFLRKCKNLYDLIIVDVFINEKVPYTAQRLEFIINLRDVTDPEGLLIYNFMVTNKRSREELKDLIYSFRNTFTQIEIADPLRIGKQNYMIVVDMKKRKNMKK